MAALPTISKQEMEDALRRSGYLIEYRVEDVVRKAGYQVSANASYPDPITQKARELDISATGAVEIDEERDWLFPILLIECVNNPYPMAFVSKEPEAETAHVYNITFSGIPVHVIRHSRPHPRSLVLSSRWRSFTTIAKVGLPRSSARSNRKRSAR